ncbi:MAG: single-stranded DNA-binding protein [Clostridia bacterium]|nr:single-stranded DNA-binding protein [Clostridia bacterium]MBQ6614620.1 single-stranded DNA-binding protein [Clostridia bacterium]
MASLNKVILIGNLTADPELKQTPTGISVVTFTVAINRRYQSKNANEGQQTADFVSIVAWRQTAEFVSRYFKKGKPILVCGALQSRSYTDSQGNKRYVTEVVADEVGFVENKSDSTSGASQYTPDAYAAPSYSNTDATAPKFEAVSDEDDLPF